MRDRLKRLNDISGWREKSGKYGDEERGEDFFLMVFPNYSPFFPNFSEKQKSFDYLNSILNHGKDMLMFHRMAQSKSVKLGQAVLRYHSNAEKEGKNSRKEK